MPELPNCSKCYVSNEPGQHWKMVPFSDFGPDGSGLEYKAWACVNSHCRNVMHIQKGVVSYENQGGKG